MNATLEADLTKSRDLQDDLSVLIAPVAEKLSVPYTSRDRHGLLREWQQVGRLRAPLNSVYRRLRKQGRDIDRTDGQRDIQNEIKSLNRCLRMWDKMDSLVRRHIDAEPHPLEMYFVPTPRDSTLAFLYTALHTLANPNPQHASSENRNYFADIPMEIQLFDLLLSAAYRLLLVKGRADTARFMDVGCGGATKVLAASRIFPKCDGLEFDPGYAKAGANTLWLTAPETGRVIRGDALKFENYADYDIIYFYRPIADDDLLREMELRIVEQSRKETIILAPYTKFLDPRADFPCAKIAGPVFVTGVTQDEADEWHENARHTDTEIIQRTRHMRFGPGFWSPILEAASFNGRA